MRQNKEKSFEQRNTEALESIQSTLTIMMVVVSLVGFSIVTKLWMS